MIERFPVGSDLHFRLLPVRHHFRFIRHQLSLLRERFNLSNLSFPRFCFEAGFHFRRQLIQRNFLFDLNNGARSVDQHILAVSVDHHLRLIKCFALFLLHRKTLYRRSCALRRNRFLNGRR